MFMFGGRLQRTTLPNFRGMVDSCQPAAAARRSHAAAARALLVI